MSFVYVHLQQFRLERCGVDTARRPGVLVGVGVGGERVLALTPRAAEQSVREGMTLAEARSHCPSLVVERLDRAAEARDLAAIAQHLSRFSPDVRPVAPEGVVLSLRAGGMPGVRRGVEGLGPCRLVGAPDAASAILLGRHFSEDAELRQEAVRAALAPISLRALAPRNPKLYGSQTEVPQIETTVLDALSVAGITTFGLLAQLPLASLASRFGGRMDEPWALARGHEQPAPPALPFRTERDTERYLEVDFPDPVEALEPMLFALHGLLRDLAVLLEQRAEALSRLKLRLRLESGQLSLPVRLGSASRTADRIFRLLRLRLDRVKLDSPALAIGLELVESVPYRPSQSGLFDRRDQTEPLADLIARLQDAMGEECVVRPRLVDRHRPEAAWVALPEGSPVPADVGQTKRDPAATHEPTTLRRPRPALLLPDPLSIRVIAAPSGRPRAVAGIGESGRVWVTITLADGPERMEGEWWAEPYTRDYWVCTLEDGRIAWIFRDGDRWSLHGWFDEGRPSAFSTPLRASRRTVEYAELLCRSHFSFCEGASSPAELVERAHTLGLSGLALTDRDGLYGAVQMHRAAKQCGLPVMQGALLTVQYQGKRQSVAALVQSREGWANLCKLLTAGRFEGHDQRVFDRAVSSAEPLGYRPDKAWAELPFGRLLEHTQGLIFLARGAWPQEALYTLREATSDHLYQAVSRRLQPGEDAHIAALVAGPLPCVATNDVLMHQPERQALQDVLTAIRLGVRVADLGTRLQVNRERCLLGRERMLARFGAWPGLIERTIEIQGRCQFSLDELQYQYPREVVPQGYTPQQWLEELTRRGLYKRYRERVPAEVLRQVDYELKIIARLNFASYFLTVHDVVRFAQSRGILCQGRGSAANSAVCYVLGVTPVDPSRQKLLFERFISEQRGEPPDIDIDFEHERREEVLQYVYAKYGRERAAMVNEVIAWRGKMAVRDVGKALGLGLDRVEELAKTLGHFERLEPEDAGPMKNRRSQDASEIPRDNADAPDPRPKPWVRRLTEAGVDPTDPTVQQLVRLCGEIYGFPRHTSIHVGGFVISDGPLIETAPIEPARMHARTVLQWDKNDIDDLGFVKVDLLALGMLTAIRKAFTLIQSTHGRVLSLRSVPSEDPAVYEMLGHADSMGVFQIESRAQQSMLPRLRPQNFYDLVVETAIVRPGPIQGGMVHPYLRRRSGEEPVTFADERLRPILERTMGVPIFQEQVMAMAVAVGGFTPGESDTLRRAMGAWRKRGGLSEIGNRLLAGMRANGITAEYADAIFKQIQGFAEYGFPESHAASFAHLVYISSWLRCHYPAAFCAALINSQPMGFYAPRSLVSDAERRGVVVLPIDVTKSDWNCTLESPTRLRLGLRLIRGFAEDAALRIMQAREQHRFDDLPDLRLRAALGKGALDQLAKSNALDGLLGASRRSAAWQVAGLWDGLFAGIKRADTDLLPQASALDEVVEDYATTGLSLHLHPVGLVRPQLTRRGFIPLGRLGGHPAGSIRVAGLVSHRQRPATASGVVFLTLEDESGSGNIVVWPKVYERQRQLVRGQQLVEVFGKLERIPGSGPNPTEVLNVIAWRFRALDLTTPLRASSRDFR